MARCLPASPMPSALLWLAWRPARLSKSGLPSFSLLALSAHTQALRFSLIPGMPIVVWLNRWEGPGGGGRGWEGCSWVNLLRDHRLSSEGVGGCSQVPLLRDHNW